MLAKLNPTVIGYALDVVGLFFLASAITFKKPRRQIEELLGIERPHSLENIRDQLVNQIQTYIGFVLLVVGFVLVMSDALNQGGSGGTPASGSAAADPNLKWIVVLLLVSTLATGAVLKLVQVGFVRSRFRRLLRRVVRDSKFNLEKNPQLTVQIGELLNVPKEPDQAISDYVRKVRTKLGIEPPGAGGPSASTIRAR